MTNYKIVKTDITETKAELLVVLCDQKSSDNVTVAVLNKANGGDSLNKALSDRIKTTIEADGFEGAVGQNKLIDTRDDLNARYVVLVGCGSWKNATVGTWQMVGANIRKISESLKAAHVAVTVHSAKINKLGAEQRIQALVEGTILGNYSYTPYKTKSATPTYLENVVFCSDKKNKGLENAIVMGTAIAEATNYTRDLVNAPSNDCTPQYLADQAKKIAKKNKLKCKVYDLAGIQKNNMRLLEAVGFGSANEPRFIHMTYTPKTKAKKIIAVVGKGVTFDTGGNCIKPSRSMYDMKFDMGGAGTVLGMMHAITTLAPKVEVHGFIPSTENTVNGKAMKPNDIVKSRSGKTVEIINTDAEGRLILADALDVACDLEPDYIIDLATLTGACRYALGEIYTAVLGTDQSLVNQLLKASTNSGEYMWQLPLEQTYYRHFTKSPADMNNIGGTMAGTISAALFLQQFVRDNKWAHLDIASSSATEEPSALCSKGATGAAVRTLCEFLRNV